MSGRSQLDGRSRRENADEAREKRYTVKVTPEEDVQLRARAIVAGNITVPRLLFESAMNANVQTRSDVRAFGRDVLELQRLLSIASNNLNQIAKFANTERMYPPEAEVAAKDVQRVARLIEEAVVSWGTL